MLKLIKLLMFCKQILIFIDFDLSLKQIHLLKDNTFCKENRLYVDLIFSKMKILFQEHFYLQNSSNIPSLSDLFQIKRHSNVEPEILIYRVYKHYSTESSGSKWIWKCALKSIPINSKTVKKFGYSLKCWYSGENESSARKL